MPATVTGIAKLPPDSIEGRISPITAAASMTPAAKDRIMSFSLCDGFFMRKPRNAPITVAPPTPRAVKSTSFIVYQRETSSLARASISERFCSLTADLMETFCSAKCRSFEPSSIARIFLSAIAAQLPFSMIATWRF